MPRKRKRTVLTSEERGRTEGERWILSTPGAVDSSDSEIRDMARELSFAWTEAGDTQGRKAFVAAFIERVNEVAPKT